jgi:hypothetical protein
MNKLKKGSWNNDVLRTCRKTQVFKAITGKSVFTFWVKESFLFFLINQRSSAFINVSTAIYKRIKRTGAVPGAL